VDPRDRVVCPTCNALLLIEERPSDLLKTKQCPKCGTAFQFHSVGWLSTDEDVVAYLDQVVSAFQVMSGTSFAEASNLVENYYRKFTDEGFCKGIGIPVQDDDFFFHEAPGGMALRIYYYLVLKEDPDPWKFVQWRATHQKAKVALGEPPRSR